MSSVERFELSRSGENLRGALTALRRRWLLVFAVVVIAVGALVYSHERKAKSYTATAAVAFQSSTLTDSALQVSGGGSSEPQREADTEVLIAHSPEVAAAAATQLGVPGHGAELLEEVKVEAAPNADVLDIQATNARPQDAARLANAFAQEYIDFKAQSQLNAIASAQAKLQQQIAGLPATAPERASLEGTLQRLGSLRAVAGGGASIIGRATPPANPTGTSLSTTVVIGLLIGLAVAFTLVFVLESLDRRLRTVEDFEREYRLPVLTAVPQSNFRHRRAGKRTDALEPFRILRSALDFVAVTRDLRTLLVTSAIPAEGKTTVAVDLAHAVALTGRRTVLVELDLRRPSFAEHFDIDPKRGLTSVLTGEASLEDVLAHPLEDVPSLLVLPGGRLPHNPSELLASARTTALIAELAADCDMLILDAPPLNPVADTQVLLGSQVIDAAIIVGRVERAKRDEVRRERAILDRHVVEPVGTVVTGLRDTGAYDYTYYRAASPALDSEVGDEVRVAERSELRL